MNTANNSLDTFYQTLSKVFGPLAALYFKAFNYNKYLAGTGFAAFITLGLFFLMVALINLGDNSLPTDNSRKLGDVIMPDRDIDTFCPFKSNENNIIDISLDTEKLVDVFEISENINLGQRIKEFIFEIKVNEKWVTIEKGTTIGMKRLIKFKPTIIKELKFTIVDSKDIPLVSELGLYKSSK